MSAAGTKKKGLSFEEKTVLVERWIAAHPQPYTMKELQQLIPKQTPVIYQSVEECVQLLVSENRVQQDRVGASTLFWKFALTETQKTKSSGAMQQGGRSVGPLTYTELLRRVTCGDDSITEDSVERLCASVAPRKLREWHTMLQAEYARAEQLLKQEYVRVGFSEEEPLQVELARLQSLTAHRARLLAQRKALSSLQTLPELLRQLAGATTTAIDAANRWTDNYYLAEMEVMAKSGQSQRDVRAALLIPAAMDFISESSNDDESKHEDEVNTSKRALDIENKNFMNALEVETPEVREPQACDQTPSGRSTDGEAGKALKSATKAEHAARSAKNAGAKVTTANAGEANAFGASPCKMTAEATGAATPHAEEGGPSAEPVEVSPATPGKGKARKPLLKKRTVRKRAR